MVEHGANWPHGGGIFGDALCTAASQGDMARIRILFELAGTHAESGVDAFRDRWGTAALLQACAAGHHRIVRKLVQHYGVNPSTMNRWGDTALHQACVRGDLACVKLLLLLNARQLGDRFGVAPLDVARTQGHAHIAALLRQHSGVPSTSESSSVVAASSLAGPTAAKETSKTRKRKRS
jgi:ankyrin repeat protein